MSDRIWTVETALAAIVGSAVVVKPDGTPLHQMLPEGGAESAAEHEAIQWLMANEDRVARWVKSLGTAMSSHPFVVVDREENWNYAVRLLRRSEWPAQDSAAHCETLLMNWAWWVGCMEAKGNRLSEHYAGQMTRLLVPGAASWNGDAVLSETERVASLARLGAGVRMLDASYEMDPKIRAWGKNWRKSGFCKVELGAKTAAAMMTSDAPTDVKSPWEAFSIIVPPGLVEPVRRLWCGSSSTDSSVVLLSAVDEHGRATATDPGLPGCGDWCTSDRHEKLINLMRGVVIAIENGGGEKKANGASARGERPEDGAPPVCERWVVSAPVQIDLREHVASEWAGGKARGRAKSWWVVRGHYRNQACGPELSERKRIWVHPYSKGDPAAAAIMRRVVIDKDSNEPGPEPTP